MSDAPRIEELRRRIEKDPASIAFAQLAEEYRRAGQYEEAARVCRAGLDKHPTYLSARVTLGRALIELGQFEEARTELNQVLRSAPENLAAIRGLAEIHQRRGNLGEALRQYQAALGIAKHDPEIEESVQDLSRMLGSAPEPVIPPPLPSDVGFPAVEPPPIPLDAPDPATSRAVDDTADAAPRAESAAPVPPASPEIEAAADEFTKALQALEALSIDLPAPQLSVDVQAPPQAEADTTDDAATPEAEQPLEEAAATETSPLDETGFESARQADSDAEARGKLESWLENIVLDRQARNLRETERVREEG